MTLYRIDSIDLLGWIGMLLAGAALAKLSPLLSTNDALLAWKAGQLMIGSFLGIIADTLSDRRTPPNPVAVAIYAAVYAFSW